MIPVELQLHAAALGIGCTCAPESFYCVDGKAAAVVHVGLLGISTYCTSWYVRLILVLVLVYRVRCAHAEHRSVYAVLPFIIY